MDINVRVQNKKLSFKLNRDAEVVCCNSDYELVFDFDDEWKPYEWKRVRFVSDGYDGRVVETDVGSNNRCKIPPAQHATFIDVGVYVDDMLKTTTPLRINCVKSILCN